ncbi:MAG TPA: hypothetical protein VJR89_09755 [Polyangiales bacterium]|nr:hypothetical protein [Polyangiales bacterium]
MRSSTRKLTLTAHITFSVGWLGAVACSLVLALAGLTARDEQVVRAAYLALSLTTSWITVPLSLAALASGLVQSWVTPWGLVRHYWVLIKLLLTVIATALLLLHAQPIRLIATQAGIAVLSMTDLREARIHLAFDAAAALLTLLVATILSVYKPRGLTPWATSV